MQSRRDQLQAYKFLVRRALAALVNGEPDVLEAPMRRLSVTTITGIMVAVLVAAGFALVGFLRPGTSTKVESGTVYIERDTGAQYIVLDGQLHPALNYTSAVLAASSDSQQSQVPTKTVAASVLGHLPHGAPVGIAGLPQSLPRGRSGLIDSPWSICSRISAQATAADTTIAKVTVAIGGVQGATPLPAYDGVVVNTPANGPQGGSRYLIWNGQRLRIDRSVNNVLSLSANQPLTIGSSLLNALPQGPALTTPSVPDLGKPGLRVHDTPTVVGQLIHVTDDGSYLLVLSDGVVRVTTLEETLLKTLTYQGAPLNPVTATQADVAHLQQSANPGPVTNQFDRLPSDAPAVPDAPVQNGGLCVVYHENSTPTLAVPAATAPQGAGHVGESARSRQGLADEVDVPSGKAALVAQDNNSATRYIIAEPGQKFAAAAATLGALGYGSATPAKLPAMLLLLIPTGPPFDTAAARRPVSQ